MILIGWTIAMDNMLPFLHCIARNLGDIIKRKEYPERIIGGTFFYFFWVFLIILGSNPQFLTLLLANRLKLLKKFSQQELGPESTFQILHLILAPKTISLYTPL